GLGGVADPLRHFGYTDRPARPGGSGVSFATGGVAVSLTQPLPDRTQPIIGPPAPPSAAAPVPPPPPMRRRRAFGPVWWLRVMVGLASTVVVAALTVGAVAVWLPALLPGYKAAAVVSGSMRPVLDEGDLVVFSTLPPPDERGL